MFNETYSDNKNKYFFDKETTYKFIDFLKTKAEVIAPHRKGEKSFSYETVESAKDVEFVYPRTIQPLKKYFLPPRETLLKFNTKENDFKRDDISEKKRIFFAIHSYEMQGIKRLDFSFSQGKPELNYLVRRKNALFIGISFIPDAYHFSESVGIPIEKFDGFCLFFQPIENGFLVIEIDDMGKELIAEFGNGFSLNIPMDIKKTQTPFKARIKYHYNRLPQIFEYVYKSKVWDKVASKCLGCGTCNLLCSTCYCFDVRDEVEMDIESGVRQRFWDSCMLKPFAEVAGGENFRDKLSNRTRHRLYRKFKYITDLSAELHCIGCGRCSKYCPADINIVEIINDLIDDYAEQHRE